MIIIVIVIIIIIMMMLTTLYCCQLFDFRILAGILVFGIIAALVATVAYIRFLSCIMYDDLRVTIKASMIWSLTRFSGSFVFCSSVYQLYLLLRARRDRKTSQVRALQHIDACTSTKGTP